MKAHLPLRSFLVIARAEGISFLFLLGVAMPLKYAADMPGATAWTGWVHGQLFLLYLIAMGSAARTQSWTWLRTAAAFVAAVVPFGTFVLERRLRRDATVAPR